MLLNRFRYFYAVAKEGSFTRAAKTLRVQQPAISKMVRQLEESLGIELLDRQKRGVELTAAGAEVFRKCQLIFDHIEEIQAFSAQENRERRGPLAIGVTDSVCSYVIPKVMRKFMGEHPAVKPSFFAGSSNLICNEIIDGRIELGIFFTAPETVDFDVSEILPVPFRLVGPKGQTTVESLAQGFIISREIDYPKSRPFPVLEMLRRNGVEVEVAISSNNLDSQKQMVLEGLGVALLPGFMVKREIASSHLSSLYPRKEFSHSLKLVKRRKRALSRNAEAFLDTFRESAELGL